jgi:thioredoxin
VLLFYRKVENLKKIKMKAKFESLIEGPQPVLVDFFATWCNPCKMQTSILHEVVGDFKDKIRIIKIDIDANQEIASKFQIRSVPTLYLFKDGKPIWNKTGVATKQDLLNLLKQYAQA